ncbi:DUF6907 domain-containing protein [Thermomonospora umbrina]|uniref:Uncharacterized protein n=1 Tax=Thermomonospora umbrina TaxID=111806 RepID=A0A3D9T9B5_9ACTN|nr:hypothetical protein [Thermomonospora umbrina]REF00352.1 hypothetical protein DFJ69_5884 [Thermomonospora umbrina]
MTATTITRPPTASVVCLAGCIADHTDPDNAACVTEYTRITTRRHTYEVDAPTGRRRVCDELRINAESKPGGPPIVVLAGGDAFFRELSPGEARNAAAALTAHADLLDPDGAE